MHFFIYLNETETSNQKNLKMRKLLLCAVLLSIFVSCKNETEKVKLITVNYPETKKVDTVDTYFGEKVADPYRWLEDDRSEETGEWVKAQKYYLFIQEELLV